MQDPRIMRLDDEPNVASAHAARRPYTTPVFMDHGMIERATQGLGRPENDGTMASLVSGPDALGYF